MDFLINAGRLKKMPRTGFKLLEIKKPETIAQHAFRVAVMNWVLACNARPKIDPEQIIKISLIHDLCEVYAGDMTPYWGLLPKNRNARPQMLKHCIRLPRDVKQKRDAQKHEKETAALKKLIVGLDPKTKKQLFGYWLEYEKMKTREGRFVKQGDKVETLLQALEYWGDKPDSPVIGWWEEIEETVDIDVFEDFLKNIAAHYYEKEKATGELNFLLKIGELKQMPRRGWSLRGVKDPETIIEHAFLMALAVWLLGKNRRLDHEKIIKMALVYEICEIYAGDETPYDKIIAKNNGRADFNSWPTSLKKTKEKMFLADYKRERKALERLTLNLPAGLKREMIGLWDQCKRQTTFEGTFVSQVYWLTTYLQALQYYKVDKKFPVLGWYEQMRQYIYDPQLIEFMHLEEKKFLSRNFANPV